ncbi:MAG: ATP-dependent DNA helicase RecG [marine bacterium B5-7]|nr:MAG: ATP-dependent DNA helicase RecG [marine bacterium B5-7]
MITLSDDCTALKGVGPRLAERLAKLGIHTLKDMLFHLPYHYQDRTRITPIRHCRLDTSAVIEGIVQSSKVQFGKRRSLLVYLADKTGAITLRFFHFNSAQQKQLAEGSRLKCFGHIKWYNGLEMVHPEYQVVDEESLLPVETHLTPVYHSTEQLHQQTWRKLIPQILQTLTADPMPEYLPRALCDSLKLPSINEALQYAHSPPPDADVDSLEEGTHPTQQRLAIEELVAHQIVLRQLRLQKQKQKAPVFKASDTKISQFMQQLPFTLTGAQQRVVHSIVCDITQGVPMQRLVQGDVGSGKTVVAAIAMLHAVMSGYQCAFMAPTEVLANQHAKKLGEWFTALDIPVTLLTSQLNAEDKRQALAAIADGSTAVAIGTHALIQEAVDFHRLGLVIIDEQHRFGVHQRLSLQQKGADGALLPHQLIMTATPIPRTLTMTAYADLDVSIIDELPPGRTPINTAVVSNQRRDEIIEKIQSICDTGQQVYWVCPLIETSEHLQCEAAEDTQQALQKLLPHLNIALMHGRMKSREKSAVMENFKDKKTHVLVATTVIEVGIDVPNATLMIIENAERLGLAQLHQLRGRVGRGSQASHCVLLYQSPLSNIAKQRLDIMRTNTDGFVIAQADLDIRGPGEILGTRQTGAMQFKVADFIRDQALLPDVRAAADTLIRDYPEQAQALVGAWIAEKAAYQQV